MELPDGSLFIVDQGSGGHTTPDAKNMSLRCLRARIRPTIPAWTCSRGRLDEAWLSWTADP